MSEEHDADEIEKQSSKSVNRRRFVKNLGVAGSAVAFGTLGSARASAENKTTESEREQLIDRALSDPNVVTIKKEFETSDRDFVRSEASASKVKDPENDSKHYSVTLPFDIGREDETAIILWSSDGEPAAGYRVNQSSDGDSNLIVYQAKNGQLKKQTYTEEELDELASNNDSTDPQVSPSLQPIGPLPTWACKGGINSTCLTDRAASAGIGCTPCGLDPTRVTCIPCAVNLLNEGRIGRRECCSGRWVRVT